MSPMQGRRPLGASSRGHRRSRLGASNPVALQPNDMIMDDPDYIPAPHPPHRPHSATAHWVDAAHTSQQMSEPTHSGQMGAHERMGYSGRAGTHPAGQGREWGEAQAASGPDQWQSHDNSMAVGRARGHPNHGMQYGAEPAHGQASETMPTAPFTPLDMLTAATQLPGSPACPAGQMHRDIGLQARGHRRIPSDSMSSQQLMQAVDFQEGWSPTSVSRPLSGFPLGSPRFSHNPHTREHEPTSDMGHGAGQAPGLAHPIDGPRHTLPDASKVPMYRADQIGGHGILKPIRRRISPPLGRSAFSQDDLDSPMGSPRDYAADPDYYQPSVAGAL